MSLYRIILTIFTVVSLFFMTKIRRIYKDPGLITSKPQTWWPYGDNAWRKFARVIYLSPCLALIGSIGAMAGEYGDIHNSAIKCIVLLSLFLLFLCVFIVTLIAITGRPKFIIPRHLR